MPAGCSGRLGMNKPDVARESVAREPLLESELTCPACGFARTERMPTDACQFFYECTRCRTLLRPKAGDCCVFCSYGSVQCPPRQARDACCK
jgi:hypothetical protein